ncbi:MexE family multidrug efflux RND transporter periplasmic adaptor subunit [Labrys miyagiensis]
MIFSRPVFPPNALTLRGRLLLPACGAILALAATSCNQQNTYAPPPPAKVGVAAPVQKPVINYLLATGNANAINSGNLVARVAGFVSAINYKDGDFAKTGTSLFTIEPQPYQLALESSQASLASADANYAQQLSNYKRQATLQTKDFASQATLEQATASRDAAQAGVNQSKVAVEQAQLNLGYTDVKAPFDGVVTARQVSLGDFVGNGTATVLATIVQLDPIYVDFNVSETDVLNIRSNMKRNGVTLADLRKVPVEIGLQNEDGYPHKGTLSYIAPSLTANTGTLAVRAELDNPGNAILPGYFVRVRVPLASRGDSLLVPDTAIGSDQGGRYVLLVGKDNVVEQRKVEIGQLDGDMRVITSGLDPTDKVVVDGILRAVPGQKVDPQDAGKPAGQDASTKASQP